MHYPAVAYLIIILVLADSRELNLLGAESCTVHCFTEHLQVRDNVWMLMHNAGCPLYPHLKATQESLQVCNNAGSRANFVNHAQTRQLCNEHNLLDAMLQTARMKEPARQLLNKQVAPYASTVELLEAP